MLLPSLGSQQEPPNILEEKLRVAQILMAADLLLNRSFQLHRISCLALEKSFILYLVEAKPHILFKP